MNTCVNRPGTLTTVMAALIILLAMVTGTVHGAFGSAHPHPCDPALSSPTAVTFIDVLSPHHCPCPSDTHDDGDGCDNCMSCGCHAPLTMQPFRLNLAHLSSSDLVPLDSRTHLPEVYLSKFIPPQNPA